MPFAFPAPENDTDRHLLDGIQTHGWSVVKVLADDGGPDFAFTIGLWANYNHPEIMMVGLDIELMHHVLNNIGDEVKTGGQRFEDGKQYPELLEGYDCAFVSVAPEHFEEYLGTAMWLYRQQPFAALQCVWPDKQGFYPWQDSFNPQWRTRQPVLNTP